MTTPIIVVGMHRSGTSMVTELLARLGLFIGWDAAVYSESRFFLRRNEAILAAHGGSWDHPDPVDRLLGNRVLRRETRDGLRRDVDSLAVLSYLGPGRFARHRSLLGLPFPWGWKDPRTTVLLPLWLDVFPGARVIHVVRDGIDVAMSLSKREAVRRNAARSPAAPARRVKSFFRVSERPAGSSAIAWQWAKLENYLNMRAAHHQGAARENPVIDPAVGFDLWGSYLTRAAEATAGLGDDLLELRYEDILIDPAAHAVRLAAHCGVPIAPTQTARLAAIVRRPDPGRPREVLELRERASSSQWMRKWGYSR